MEDNSRHAGSSKADYPRWGAVYIGVGVFTGLTLLLLYLFSQYYAA